MSTKRICFITSELFVGKRRGGFGKLVHIAGVSLLNEALMYL